VLSWETKKILLNHERGTNKKKNDNTSQLAKKKCRKSREFLSFKVLFGIATYEGDEEETEPERSPTDSRQEGT